MNERLTEKYISRGKRCFIEGKYEHSLQHFLGARMLAPENTVVLDNLARVYFFLGSYEESLECILSSLDSKPINDDIINNLGVLFEELGKKEQAIDYYKLAFEMNPLNSSPMANLGFLCQKAGRPDEALEALKISNRIEPDSLDVLEAMAFCFIMKNSYRAAYKTLRRIIYKYPGHYKAYDMLAGLYFTNDMPWKAVKFLKKALELEKDDGAVYFNLANTYMSLMDIPKALEIYIMAVCRNPLFKDVFQKHNFFSNVGVDDEVIYHFLTSQSLPKYALPITELKN